MTDLEISQLQDHQVIIHHGKYKLITGGISGLLFPTALLGAVLAAAIG